METITYLQVQQLVQKLPEYQMPIAYRLLFELVGNEVEPQSPQAAFMQLSAEEQHVLLSQQAEQMKAHYEQIADERAEWQAGDFMYGGQTSRVSVRLIVSFSWQAARFF